MPALFIYLIKVNVALLIFCAGYYAVLRHLTFYNLNRVYLVTAIIFSTLYPKVNVSDFLNRHEQIAKPIQVVVLNWQEPVKTIAKTFAGHDQWFWLQVAFWAGVCVFAIRLGVQLLSLYRLHKRSEPAQLHQYMIRVIKGDLNPFSFWRNIYINPDNHPPHELSAILEHEQIHVNEWHTLDILLGEISAIFYWFNPGIWLMKRAIRENIEFITDQKILQKGVDSKAYQYSLLNVNFGAQQNTIVNHFNISTIKKRIMMMNAKRSSKVNITRYLFLIPAVMVLLLIFSASKAELRKAVKNSAHIMTDLRTDIIKITLKTIGPISARRGKTDILKAISVFNIDADTVKKSDAVKLTGKLITDTSTKYVRLNFTRLNGKEINIVEGLPINTYSYLIASRDTDVKKKLIIRGDKTDGTKADIYVNGVKVDNALDKINPEDINGIQVRGTKDVSPNGAIYITTKSHEPVKVLNIRKTGDSVYTVDGKGNVNHVALVAPKLGMNVNGGAVTLTTGSEIKKVRLNGKEIDTKDLKFNKILINGDTVYTTTLPASATSKSPHLDSLLTRMTGYTVAANGSVTRPSNIEHVVVRGNYSGTSTIKPAPISFANKLIIIDGKEATEKQLKKVSADKIDSISNLNYEAAKSLYGDKAKNGVVIIATKK